MQAKQRYQLNRKNFVIDIGILNMCHIEFIENKT